MHKMSKESASTLSSLRYRLDKAEDLIRTLHTMCNNRVYNEDDIKKQINVYWGTSNEKKI